MLAIYDKNPAFFERKGYTKERVASTYLKMPIGAGLVMLAVMQLYG